VIEPSISMEGMIVAKVLMSSSASHNSQGSSRFVRIWSLPSILYLELLSLSNPTNDSSVSYILEAARSSHG
jgi:hypothetical protein